MHNLGTYLLWSLAACTLFPRSLAEDPIQSDSFCPNELRPLINRVVQGQHRANSRADGIQTKVRRLEGQLQGVEAKLEESLLAIQTRLENQLQAALNKLENQLQAVSSKLDADKEELPDLVGNTTIPSGFERIGRRYFRMVYKVETWIDAQRRCREMGGYLASFQNEEDFTALRNRLLPHRYWLGINDLDTKGHFVSVASNKSAQFLNWFEGHPTKNPPNHCVSLSKGEMWTKDCSDRLYFICQADNEI